MRLIVAGPGRAGGAVTLAAIAAGHSIEGLIPGPSGRVPAPLSDLPVIDADGSLEADLLVIAVRDDAIADVAAVLAPRCAHVAAAIHLSGFTSVTALEAFEARGIEAGSLHPLQTLPSPEVGASLLPGAYAALTSRDSGLLEELAGFARTLGMKPFVLGDERKPAYHAAASSVSNFVVAALLLAERLARSAQVPFEAFRPLAEAMVSNAFDLGPGPALTGPVARGDVGTVAGQMAASDVAGVGAAFRAMVEATVDLSGGGEDIRELARR